MQKCRKASRVKAIAQTINAAAHADTVLGAGSLKQTDFCVGKETEWLSQTPCWEGVGREAGVN